MMTKIAHFTDPHLGQRLLRGGGISGTKMQYENEPGWHAARLRIVLDDIRRRGIFGQGCHLPAVDAPQFRHQGRQGGGGFGAGTRDGAQDRGVTTERGMGGNGRRDGAVDGGELVVEAVEQGFAKGLRSMCAGGLEAIGAGLSGR